MGFAALLHNAAGSEIRVLFSAPGATCPPSARLTPEVLTQAGVRAGKPVTLTR